MGRGAQAQTRQLTDQQLASINGTNQQLLGQQQLTRGRAKALQRAAGNPAIHRGQKEK